MWKPNRDSNYWLRDHVNHNKFCFDIKLDKRYNAEHLICRVLLNRISALSSPEGLVSIYDVNCLLKENAVAKKQ